MYDMDVVYVRIKISHEHTHGMAGKHTGEARKTVGRLTCHTTDTIYGQAERVN